MRNLISLKETRDYEDYDLPADERWLRKYLHQGLDRWPSESIVKSLLSKRSNTEPLTIWRGMNFRDQESMDEFVNNFKGYWNQSGGISSWSPDEETAREFAYVRKTYFPDQETFRQEQIARETGEKMRGVGGVLLKMTVPPNTVIEFEGGYESEVLLPAGKYPCEMEIIKPYREQIKNGFDINAYILSLKHGQRSTEDIEHYIRKNHITDLSQKALRHLFKLDGGDRLAETAHEVSKIPSWSTRDSLYTEELRFSFREATLDRAYEGFYGEEFKKVAQVAAKKIFNEFAKLEKQHPDAKLYTPAMGSLAIMSGQQQRMKQIIKRRFADRYHELNERYRGGMSDNIDWPKNGLRTVAEQMKELFSQYNLLTN